MSSSFIDVGARPSNDGDRLDSDLARWFAKIYRAEIYIKWKYSKVGQMVEDLSILLGKLTSCFDVWKCLSMVSIAFLTLRSASSLRASSPICKKNSHMRKQYFLKYLFFICFVRKQPRRVKKLKRQDLNE